MNSFWGQRNFISLFTREPKPWTLCCTIGFKTNCSAMRTLLPSGHLSNWVVKSSVALETLLTCSCWPITWAVYENLLNLVLHKLQHLYFTINIYREQDSWTKLSCTNFKLRCHGRKRSISIHGIIFIFRITHRFQTKTIWLVVYYFPLLILCSLAAEIPLWTTLGLSKQLQSIWQKTKESKWINKCSLNYVCTSKQVMLCRCYFYKRSSRLPPSR